MAVLMTTAAVNVTTAGTRVPLSATTLLVYDFEVQAKPANTGTIYLGSVAVTSTIGRRLAAGGTFSLAGLIDDGGKSKNLQVDLGTIYIDSTVNGEGVIVTYLIR
jgi:hypothetical protein